MKGQDYPPCFANQLPTKQEAALAARSTRRALADMKGIRHFELLAERDGAYWTVQRMASRVL
jgi:hypothetical protein